jgi:Ni2+-binding GTPase involved in maturation of urease and hydrogenase
MTGLRFIMLGGFLGAGKTTTIGRLAATYQRQGLRVGIVTNDQATDLVDTQLLRSQGFQVGEVAGACFCCNFTELTDTVAGFAADQRPDIVLAEPVGSCTDLVATVVQPLKQLYQDRFDVAPYGVVLKPSHGLRILGQTDPKMSEVDRPGRSGFSPQAAYIFEKQLEEADFVLINRIDELPLENVERLELLLRQRLPDREILRISARTGAGFETLLEVLDRRGSFGNHILNINYDRYAAGEAELGWLNCTAKISADHLFSLDALVLQITRSVGAAMIAANSEVAHVKTIGQSDMAHAVANVISNEDVAELSLQSSCQTATAEIVVNARVAAAPDMIENQVRQALREVAQSIGGDLVIGRIQSFRPGRPVPTHRFENA